MLTINLSPELEQAVQEQAQQQGTTSEQIVIDSVQKMYPLTLPIEAEGDGTLADYWWDYIGSIDSSEKMTGGANLSSDTGRRFATLMTLKYRWGEL